MKLHYPTQNIVENCLKTFFPVLKKGCLCHSISKIGTIAECHHTPGQYGILPCKVNSITGVDIPFLVKNDNGNGKTVAIVAQDPLRNDEDTNLHPLKPFNHPIVGTPFAFHYKMDKSNNPKFYPQTEVYRLIIHGLLGLGYNVYVTDIWKCWDKYKTYRGWWTNCNPNWQCLSEEMNAIVPDIIVLMGAKAQKSFSDKFQKGISKPIVPIKVYHPSGSANSVWKRKIGGCNAAYKAGYIINLVKTKTI